MGLVWESLTTLSKYLVKENFTGFFPSLPGWFFQLIRIFSTVSCPSFQQTASLLEK
jgi:hypothetical protein